MLEITSLQKNRVQYFDLGFNRPSSTCSELNGRRFVDFLLFIRILIAQKIWEKIIRAIFHDVQFLISPSLQAWVLPSWSRQRVTSLKLIGFDRCIRIMIVRKLQKVQLTLISFDIKLIFLPKTADSVCSMDVSLESPLLVVNFPWGNYQFRSLNGNLDIANCWKKSPDNDSSRYSKWIVSKTPSLTSSIKVWRYSFFQRSNYYRNLWFCTQHQTRDSPKNQKVLVLLIYLGIQTQTSIVFRPHVSH